LKSRVTEIKDSLEGIHGRAELAEARYSKLEDRPIKMTQPKIWEKKEWRNMNRDSEKWGTPLCFPSYM